jgi:thioredoxin reductase (NADPH)
MIQSEELLAIPLYAEIPEALRARIASRSADYRVDAGEWLVQEGSHPYFWTVLDGQVEVVKRFGSHVSSFATFSRGEYFGEIPLLLGSPVFVGVRAVTEARLLRIDRAEFHLLVAQSSVSSTRILQTAMGRLGTWHDAYVTADFTEAAIVGDRYDLACHDIRDFLARNLIPYEWLDPNDPSDAVGMPADARNAERYPLVILANGSRLDTPTPRQLAESLNLQTCPGKDTYDVAIVGGGPAGLAAAVYGGSEGLKTIMIEREAPGGQAGTSSRIENYLGFPAGVSGDDLADRALQQAKRFGSEILVTRTATGIEAGADNRFTVELDGGDRLFARAIVIAIGLSWRSLDAEGAGDLAGRGVYYGAAQTEALGTRDKDVFLIGGGNSAGQAAILFSSYARSVTLLIRGPSLEKTMSYYLIQQLASKRNIAVETGTVVTRVSGNAHIESIVTKTGDNAERERPADALFVFIGAEAETAWLPDAVSRDARGYLYTGRDIANWLHPRPPFPLETSVPGIFAAGDVRSTSVKRVASGVGEGSMVISFIHQYLYLAGDA